MVVVSQVKQLKGTCEGNAIRFSTSRWILVSVGGNFTMPTTTEHNTTTVLALAMQG